MEPIAAPLLAEGRHVAGPARDFVDHYFRGQDVLKTYEIDYGSVIAFDTEVARSMLIGMVCLPPSMCCGCMGLAAFNVCAAPNARDAANATHVAITRDGIKFVVDRHKTACRLDCQDVGKVSKTVPYDKMTDCDIEEPAGSEGFCCYLVPRTLKVVHVDTASSGFVGGEGGIKEQHELTLRGLVDPEGFKSDVWAMKRGEPVDGIDGTVAPMAVSMHRGDGNVGSSTGGSKLMAAAPSADSKVLAPLLEEQTVLLKELLATQRETNELLKARAL